MERRKSIMQDDRNPCAFRQNPQRAQTCVSNSNKKKMDEPLANIVGPSDGRMPPMTMATIISSSDQIRSEKPGPGSEKGRNNFWKSEPLMREKAKQYVEVEKQGRETI